MEKHLFQNLYINNDSVEILDFMTDHMLMPKSFDANWVCSYLEEKDFYLLFFLRNNQHDEFIWFRFLEFSEYPDSMLYLNDVLKNLVESDYFTYKPVQQKLEEMIYMRPVFQAYYQAIKKE